MYRILFTEFSNLVNLRENAHHNLAKWSFNNVQISNLNQKSACKTDSPFNQRFLFHGDRRECDTTGKMTWKYFQLHPRLSWCLHLFLLLVIYYHFLFCLKWKAVGKGSTWNLYCVRRTLGKLNIFLHNKVEVLRWIVFDAFANEPCGNLFYNAGWRAT